MKTLREIKFSYNQDKWSRSKEVVSVNTLLSPDEVMRAWINSKHPTMVDPTYCDQFTSNWTSGTFYDIDDDCTHSWGVSNFYPKEL